MKCKKHPSVTLTQMYGRCGECGCIGCGRKWTKRNRQGACACLKALRDLFRF